MDFKKLPVVYMLKIAAVILAALMVAAPASAEVYMLRDSRGVIFFTDHMPENRLNFTVLKKYNFPGQRSGAKTRGYQAQIVNKAMPANYDQLIMEASNRYNLDHRLVKSVIQVESNFNRFAVSNKGARGLMQLMPNTAKLLNVNNSFDPAENINGGAKYLRMMLNSFGGNLKHAIAAYNAGPDAVRQYGGIPPYRETIDYVNRVNRTYAVLSGKVTLADITEVSVATPYRYKTASANYYKPKKAVFYTYTNSNGEPVFTDKPMGKMQVISD